MVRLPSISVYKGIAMAPVLHFFKNCSDLAHMTHMSHVFVWTAVKQSPLFAKELGQNGGMAAPRYLLVRLGCLTAEICHSDGTVIGNYEWLQEFPQWSTAFRWMYPCRDWCCTSSSFQVDRVCSDHFLLQCFEWSCCQIGLWSTMERLPQLRGVFQPRRCLSTGDLHHSPRMDTVDTTHLVQEVLTCPCCLSIFRQPIGLPCGHSLCRRDA